jgi:hypothetical protein
MANQNTPTTWANRITGHGEEPVDQLLAHPFNFRIHSRLQQDVTAAALDDVGWVQPLLLNTRTGHLLDGHMRVMIALSRGEPTVPVAYVDLSPQEETRALVFLHQTSQYAGIDRDLLREAMADAEQLTENADIRRMFTDLQAVAKRVIPMSSEPQADSSLFVNSDARPVAEQRRATAPGWGASGDDADPDGIEEPTGANTNSGRGNVELKERDYGPERFAIPIVLTKEDHRRWQALKGAMAIKSDSAALVALLDKLDSGELRLAGEG